MKKLCIISALLLCVILTGCGKNKTAQNEAQVQLEDPILDNIPVISVDESLFNLIGATFDKVSREYGAIETATPYNGRYKIKFVSSDKNFIFDCVESPTPEDKVYSLILPLGSFVRTEGKMSKEELDKYLNEGTVSDDGSILYQRDGYNIRVDSNGSVVYATSKTSIWKIHND